jgi:hypothetical protein
MLSLAAGDGSVSGDVLSEGGERCGVRIRDASGGSGCGDVIVSVSLDSRECVISDTLSVLFLVGGAASCWARALRESDLGGIRGADSSGGVSGDMGDTACGSSGNVPSAFRYSGVGGRFEGYLGDVTSSLLEESNFDCASFSLSFNFASLFPMNSGCGGAGRAGMGFRVVLRGS